MCEMSGQAFYHGMVDHHIHPVLFLFRSMIYDLFFLISSLISASIQSGSEERGRGSDNGNNWSEERG